MKRVGTNIILGVFVVLAVMFVVALLLRSGFLNHKKWDFWNPSYKIQAVSLVSNFDLEIANRAGLNLFLEEVGFWGEKALSDIRFPEQTSTARSLLIRLVDEPEAYWWRQTTKDGEIVAAVNSAATKDGEVRIDIFVWDKILKDDSFSRDRRLSSLFIRGIYGIVSGLREGAGVSNQEKNKHMNEFVKKYVQRYSDLLRIEEKQYQR